MEQSGGTLIRQFKRQKRKFEKFITTTLDSKSIFLKESNRLFILEIKLFQAVYILFSFWKIQSNNV